MPELPEVETFKKYLESELLNLTISDLFLETTKALKTDNINELKHLKGQSLKSIGRFGKYLVFNFDKNYLISHLRLEGKWKILNKIDKDKIDNNHIIIAFLLSNSKWLVLTDHRKFATLDFFDNRLNLKDNPIFMRQGKEPWSLSYEELEKKISKSSSPIKTKLLDQSVISGLGNIYVDEVLFACGLNPARKCNELNSENYKCIIENSKKILSKSIKLGGTSIYSYSVNNNKGSYLDELKVHLQNNRECLNCGKIILKTKVNQRGTYYCPNCQK